MRVSLPLNHSCVLKIKNMAEFIEAELVLNEERLARNHRLAVFRANVRANAAPFDLPDMEFLKNFRLSQGTVMRLYAEVEPFLPNQKQGAITKMNKLLTTLHFLGGGSYQRGVGNSMFLGMSQAKVSQIVNEVVEVLNDPQIYNNHVKFPQNVEERRAVVEGYHRKFGVPGVLGCIDCTHVAMVRPSEHEERFYCRKRYHSRNVQIICDSDLFILNADASYGGATHDSFIWRFHELHEHMQALYANGEAMWFFGDSGYPLRPWLLTPIIGAEEGTPEHHYYEKHVTLRNTVERCIGVLKARWRCMLAHRTLHYHHLTVGKIVYACCMLHNMANTARDPVPHIDEEDVIADRLRQNNPDYVLPHNELQHLYTDLELGVAQRQQLVASLWRRRN